MAVYTHLSEEQLADVANRYGLGALQYAQAIAQGVENSNYLMQGEKARAILTLFEKRTRPEDLPFFMALLDHLVAAGFPCPEPLKTRQGQALIDVAGKPAAMVSFLDGQSKAAPNVQDCRQLGMAMARLHIAGQDAPLTRANDLSLKGWQTLYDRLQGKLNKIEARLELLVKDELAFLAAHWPSNLPCGIIHADLFPDNVFFDQSGTLSGIIDFYFACEDSFAYEIGICLNCWCFEQGGARFHETHMQALLEGYAMVRPLQEAEREALIVLARGAALRFLLTRAHDWVFHDEHALVTPHDPREYIRKLQYWQGAL